MKKNKIILYLAVILFTIIILNLKVSTKQGLDYKVHVYKIPLYIKIIEFIDRDYRYKELSREITKGRTSDADKAMAILKWVQYNIKTDVPKSWPIYDDHILNIIIRGYGEPDQINDVFTTLCAYAGLPAGWKRFYADEKKESAVLSFVKIDGKWRVFDVAGGSHAAHENYLQDIESHISDITLRSRMQMPLKRLVYEIKRFFTKGET